MVGNLKEILDNFFELEGQLRTILGIDDDVNPNIRFSMLENIKGKFPLYDQIIGKKLPKSDLTTQDIVSIPADLTGEDKQDELTTYLQGLSDDDAIKDHMML